MELRSAEITQLNDYSKIGYFGRPISDLDRDELLAAFAKLAELYTELAELYQESKIVIKTYMDLLDSVERNIHDG